MTLGYSCWYSQVLLLTLSFLSTVCLSNARGYGCVSIHTGPQYQRVHAGADVKFLCNPDVTACTESGHSGTYIVSTPRVYWMKDDRKLTQGHTISNSHHRMDSQTYTLTLLNVTTQDTGLYTCVATVGNRSDNKSAELTVQDVPDPPINVDLTSCGERVAQIQWQLISENYSPVTHYIIEYNTSFSPDVWRFAKNLRRTKQFPRQRNLDEQIEFERVILSPWGNYSFRVIAKNGVGQSRPSKPTQRWCKMPADRPRHHPNHVCTLNVRPNTLAIAWQPMPKEEHNGPGFHYVVRWSRHDIQDEMHTAHVSLPHDLQSEVQSVQIDEWDTSHYIIDNQPTYKPYNISVQAANDEGFAVKAYKKIIGYSSEDVPLDAVEDFRLDGDKSVTNTTAAFVWSHVNIAPWRLQGVFTAYKIEFWKSNEGITSMRNHTINYDKPPPCWRERHSSRHDRQKRQTGSSSGEANVSSKQKRNLGIFKADVMTLWPYTEITAQIRVMNAKYVGPPSKPVFFKTKEGVPGAVRQLVVAKKDAHNFELEWQPPLSSNGIIVGYTLDYSAVDPGVDRGGRLFLGGSSTSYPLTDLVEDTLYIISLFASTSAGRGEEITIEDYTLQSGPPVAPNFTTANVSKRSVNVTWFPSTDGNPGNVFTVQYKKLGDLAWTKTREIRGRRWNVIDGLRSQVVYEIRVVAKSGNTENSLETSSPVKRVHIGLKRNLPQPTFSMRSILNTLEVVLNDSADAKAVRTFCVQYKTIDDLEWRSSDDIPKGNLAIIDHLQSGQTYHIKVTTTSEFGVSPSRIQEFHCCGHDESSNGPAKPLTLSSTSTCSPLTILMYSSIIFSTILLQLLRGYL